MNNYIHRTIQPIAVAIADEMKRKWLTKTARTKGQSIVYYYDPFTLIPVSEIANFADVFQRNEIMTSNEMRQKVGLPPSSDPRADELNNANMPNYDQPVYEENQNEEVPQTEVTENKEVYFNPSENNNSTFDLFKEPEDTTGKPFSLFK